MLRRQSQRGISLGLLRPLATTSTLNYARPLVSTQTILSTRNYANNTTQDTSITPRRKDRDRDMVSNFFTSPFERMWSQTLFPDLLELDVDDLLDVGRKPSRSRFTPRVNVSETDKSIIVQAEVPGMKKEDIQLEVKDDTLVLKGEKKMEKKEEDPQKKYTRVESSYGSFQRTIDLPEGVDPSKVKAKYKNGILEVEIEKPIEEKKGATIQISD
jgi:HSP20 family protein